MSKMIETPRDSGRGGHYSQATRAGDFVFVSGQTPRDANRMVIGTTIEEQTDATLGNVRVILEAAGGSLENVVTIGVFLKDLNDAGRFDKSYAKHFSSFRPARTTVGCDLNGVLVEISATAYIPETTPTSPLAHEPGT